MRLALIAVLAVACRPDMQAFPPEPGGGGIPGGGSAGSSMSTMPDANTGEIVGFVCVLTDPRDFTTCSEDDLSGITVSLTGVPSVTTGSNGAFVIQRPTGTNLTFAISGSNVTPSTMGFGTSPEVFAMSIQTANDLLAANGVVVDPTQGTILGVVVHGSTAVPFVRVVAEPIGVFPDTFFSTVDDLVNWPGSDTSSLGTFMVAGLTPGTEALTVTPGSGSASVLENIPVGSGAFTFMTVQQ